MFRMILGMAVMAAITNPHILDNVTNAATQAKPMFEAMHEAAAPVLGQVQAPAQPVDQFSVSDKPFTYALGNQ